MLVLTRSRGKGVVISHNGSIYDLMLIQVYHSHKIKLKITKRNEDIKKNYKLRINDEIKVDDEDIQDLTIKNLGAYGKYGVRIGFDAPREIIINRSEVYDRILKEGKKVDRQIN